jgi:hypothetical protein
VMLITTPLIISFSTVSSSYLPLSTSHPLSSPFSNTLNLRSPRNTEVRSSPTMTKESRTVRSHQCSHSPFTGIPFELRFCYDRSVRHSDEQRKSLYKYFKRISEEHPRTI